MTTRRRCRPVRTSARWSSGVRRRYPEVLERTGARHVVFSFTPRPGIPRCSRLLRECQRLGIDVSVMPRLFENVNGRVQGGAARCGCHCSRLRQTNPRSWQFALKHASDRLFAATMLVLLAPLLGLVALIVKLTTPGRCSTARSASAAMPLVPGLLSSARCVLGLQRSTTT